MTITFPTFPAIAQSVLTQAFKSFQSTVAIIRNAQAQVLGIQNVKIGFQRYHVNFTWQSFDDIYQQRPELMPLLNQAETSYQAAERIANLLSSSDRIALPHTNEGRFYIPFKVVASFIWYVEAVATEHGWQVNIREPISRSARCPYVVFHAA